MKCSNCGDTLPTDAKFCPQCGRPLTATAANQAPTAPSADAAAAATATSLVTPRNHDPHDNHEIIWEGGYSAQAMIPTYVAAGAGSIALLIATLLWMNDGASLLYVLAAIALLWLFLAGVYFYRRLSVHYRLTTQRFFHEHGLLSRITDRIEVIAIDDVTVMQKFIERLLGTGRIKLVSSDRNNPEFLIDGLANVKHIAELIDEARRAERNRRSVRMEAI